ncbi:MAG: PQQ-binding-like beta-propeller repeat protein [Chloroflexia bacterium]
MYLRTLTLAAKVFAFVLAAVAAMVIVGATASAAPPSQKGGVDAPDANQAYNWGGETAVPTGTPVPGWTESVSNGYSFSDSITVHSGLYSIHMETQDSSSSGSGVAGGGACAGGVRIPITAGTNYTWSAWTNIPPITGNVFFIRVQITWWNACTGGTKIGATAISNEPALDDGVWRFVTGSANAPAGATHARIELVGRATSGTFTGYFDDVTFDVTTGTTPSIQWTQSLPGGGAYGAAPAIGFSSTGESLIFVGGNSGSHVAYRATATATPAQLWTTSVGGAIQNRATVLTILGTKVVYFTSLNGCVNAFNAVTGASWWGTSGCINVGSSLLAGAAYQPAQSGGPSVPLIMVATNSNNTANKVVALNAETGAVVWTFNNTGILPVGPINSRPAVGWAPNNAVYFGSNNVSGVGGGLWALNTANGTLKWSQPAALVGTVSNSQPSINSSSSTVYVGTDDFSGSGRTLRAINTTDGSTRASLVLAAGSNFFGAPWPNPVGGGTDVYFTYGNRVYAVTDTGGATLPLKTGFGVGTNGYTNMPGGSTPLVLTSKSGLFIGGNDGGFYKMNISTGSGVGRVFLGVNSLVSDATYDGIRDAFYIVHNSKLYSFQGNWTDVGLGPSNGGQAPGGNNAPPAQSKPGAGNGNSDAPNANARLSALGMYSSPNGSPKTAFSASSDNYMYTRMVWTGVTGQHTARLTIYSPDGNVYQVVDAPFTGQGNRATEVWGELPIVGTWMARMPGKWTVQVRLDSSLQVYGQTSFTLNP